MVFLLVFIFLHVVTVQLFFLLLLFTLLQVLTLALLRDVPVLLDCGLERPAALASSSQKSSGDCLWSQKGSSPCDPIWLFGKGIPGTPVSQDHGSPHHQLHSGCYELGLAPAWLTWQEDPLVLLGPKLWSSAERTVVKMEATKVTATDWAVALQGLQGGGRVTKSVEQVTESKDAWRGPATGRAHRDWCQGGGA